MSEFKPTKIDLSKINDGKGKYNNGDGVQAETINTLVEGVAFAQENGGSAYVLYKNGTDSISAPIESRDFWVLRYYDNVSDTIKSFTSNEERDVWLSGKTNNNIIFDTQAEKLDLVYDSLGQPYTNKYYAFFEGAYYLLVNANDIYYVLGLGNGVLVAENNIPDRWVVSTSKTSQTCVLQVSKGAVDRVITEELNKKIQLYKHTLTDSADGIRKFIIITTGASELLFTGDQIRIPAGQQVVKVFRIRSETTNGGFGDLCLYRSMNFITYGFEDIYEVKTISGGQASDLTIKNIIPNGFIDTVTEVQGA